MGLQEGRAEKGRSLVLRLLNRRVGTIAPELKIKIEALTIDYTEQSDRNVIVTAETGENRLPSLPTLQHRSRHLV